MTYFHGNSTLLEPGSVIQPGNWGRIIKKAEWRHALAMREVLFEHVRQSEFPHAPSRLESAYFFDDEGEAAHYLQTPDRAFLMIMYEVELVDPNATQIMTDYRRVHPSGPLGIDWVRAYWRGEMLAPENKFSCREILAVTPLRIIRRVG